MPDPGSDLEDLKTKLNGVALPKVEPSAPPEAGLLSQGTRLGTDLIIAAVVGVGAGLLLDRWLGTAPWMTLIFSILGLAVGCRNFYELARKLLHSDPPPPP